MDSGRTAIVTYLVMKFVEMAAEENSFSNILTNSTKSSSSFIHKENCTVLRIATSEDFVLERSIANCTEQSRFGSCVAYEILHEIASYFNFSYEYVIPEDRSFGVSYVVNGTEVWSGVVGALNNNEADIGSSLFTITPERLNVISFTRVVYEDKISFIYLSPKELGNSKALLSPLEPEVWALIGAVSFVMIPLLYVSIRLQCWLIKDESPHNQYSLVECAWFVYSGLVKQGVPRVPKDDLVRFLFVVWWIFTLLVSTFYSANLTAFLTLPTFSTIDTLDAMLENPQLKWIVLEGSAFDGAIQASQYEDFKKLQKSYENGGGLKVRSTDEAKQYVLKGDYVYFDEMIVLDEMVFKDFKKAGRCRIIRSNFAFFTSSLAFAFPKGSPYISEFDSFISLLSATGLINKWIRQYSESTTECNMLITLNTNQKASKLSANELATAFFIYMVGASAGLLSLIAEKVLKKQYNSNKHNNYKTQYILPSQLLTSNVSSEGRNK